MVVIFWKNRSKEVDGICSKRESLCKGKAGLTGRSLISYDKNVTCWGKPYNVASNDNSLKRVLLVLTNLTAMNDDVCCYRYENCFVVISLNG